MLTEISLTENENYKNLKSFMKNPETLDFVRKYFTNDVDTKMAVMYIKLYQRIYDKYHENFGISLTQDEVVRYIHVLITDRETRYKILQDDMKILFAELPEIKE